MPPRDPTQIWRNQKPLPPVPEAEKDKTKDLIKKVAVVVPEKDEAQDFVRKLLSVTRARAQWGDPKPKQILSAFHDLLMVNPQIEWANFRDRHWKMIKDTFPSLALTIPSEMTKFQAALRRVVVLQRTKKRPHMAPVKMPPRKPTPPPVEVGEEDEEEKTEPLPEDDIKDPPQEEEKEEKTELTEPDGNKSEPEEEAVLVGEEEPEKPEAEEIFGQEDNLTSEVLPLEGEDELV